MPVRLNFKWVTQRKGQNLTGNIQPFSLGIQISWGRNENQRQPWMGGSVGWTMSSTHQKVAGSISSQGRYERQPIDVSLFLSLPSSLKPIKHPQVRT